MAREEKWTARSHPKRFVIYLVVFGTVMALIGAGFGAAVKAWGA